VRPLADHDRNTVRAQLSGIIRPVTILFFTQTFGAPDTVLVARQVLDEVLSLSSMVSLREVDVVDTEQTALYGIEHSPAIVLLAGGEDTRIRFLGAPAGYEFMSLVEALILAGTGVSGLSPSARTLIATHATAPTHIRVFVTPTCAYCPRAVTLAHRMAVESRHIRATCVEATEFIDLSRKYRVTGVPKTVVNESIEMLGAFSEDEFVRTVLGLSGAPPA
jgi:glutaredoxin-like protein